MTLSQKIVFIGDSYGQGWTPNGVVKSWTKFVPERLPIENGQRIASSSGGDGFARPEHYRFSELLDALSADNSVKYVIIGGGYNDRNSSAADILSGMSNCKTIVQNKFPNATMCVAFIGGTTDASQQSSLATTKQNYATAASTLGVVNLNNTDVLIASDFSSDGIHPNEIGQQRIAKAIVSAMNAQL